MTNILIDCRKIATDIKNDIKQKLSKARTRPILYTIQVGENSTLETYIKDKKNDCNEVGIDCRTIYFRETITENDLINFIKNLNEIEEYDGIIIQLPLPDHIDNNNIIATIPKEKDVGGLKRNSDFKPCTPLGIMKVLEQFDVDGKDCLIINRNDIIGKPLANFLLDKNATVTIAYSHTKDLEKKIANSDIIISAVGIPRFIKSHMIGNNKVFIDAAINRNEEGKLCGDIEKETYNYLYRNSYVTPVPNGVHLLTRAMLLQNTYDSYKRRVER